MSRVLVVGGTGLAGRAVTAEAVARGHQVVVAARRIPDDDSPAYVDGVAYVTADLVTGAGLEEAVDGVDVLIDASNAGGRRASHVFAHGSRNLLHTAARYGVGHAVLLSIAGIDGARYPYYRSKLAQERTYLDSPLEVRIVRTTQFHDFVTSVFERGRRFGTVTAPSSTRVQPIALTDVARVLVDAAEGSGEPGTRTVGGPRVESARSLARQWKDATGTRRPILSVRLGGPLGSAWRAGRHLAPEHAVDGGTGYAAWLTESA
ncbi:SDR family oxidoreductase [Leifsonia shinshuensis]|uniref:NAD(P)H-binding protein n=1 Tax=Leifsonia shinshuensis TaxID=150026 RepID=A0A7G6Y7K0_9MICO|nr:NAD(P)H-binding protein [Leifsonia shinshuensis]QNE34465.1 NAD(P)H-binding protein [Leifsonia shinshuensis]